MTATDLDDGPLESVRFTGLKPGPKLIVLGAVHGNEPCGPLAIRRAIEECRAGRLKIRRGELTFVPVANPKIVVSVKVSLKGFTAATDALKAEAFHECSNCGELKRPHNLCNACGHYNGREVIAVEL